MSEAAAMIEFLRARLDEDAAAANAVDGIWRADDAGNIVDDSYAAYLAIGPHGGGIDEATRAHILRHDPARVLREVEAKRDTVNEYAQLLAEWDGLPTYVQEHCQRELEALERAVRHLAGVYRDHPGYRPDW